MIEREGKESNILTNHEKSRNFGRRKRFESYIFLMTSQNSFQKESEPIYRHSFLGKFDVKDLKVGKNNQSEQWKFCSRA